uniref:glycohydrolase toxin TNT-related protein n=1 Tax=Frateuria defendens TaxID=2219559 RepID=UPI00066FC299
QQNGFTIELAAAMARAKADGDGHANHASEVTAGNVLSLSSGRDTTLHGAQASGDTVLANVGRNLDLTSTQDTQTYKELDQSASAGLSLCIPPICYGSSSASVSYSQTNIRNNYQSVTAQTGIQAGQGGYDIHVGGNTNLTGGAIASTADASQNLLDTGSFSYSDLKNKADYSASQMGATVSASFGGGGGDGGGGGNAGGGSDTGAGANASQGFSMGVMPSLSIPQSHDASSTTPAGLASGTLTIRDNPGQDLSGLNRDVTALDGNGVANRFDVDKVKERLQLGQVAGQVGMQAAGDIGQALTQPYEKAAVQAVKDQQALQSGLLSDEGRQAVQSDLNQQMAIMNANQGTFDTWKAGGAGETLLHTGIGAIAAGMGGGNALQGALGAGVGEVSSPYLMQHLGASGAVFGSTLIGAAVGGGSGAAVANAGTLYNDIHHYSDYQAELDACKQSPSASGCGTILAMQGDHSVPLTRADGVNQDGVIANLNDQNQVVSYTITNPQNQTTLIMQPSDYKNYLVAVGAGSNIYDFMGNNSPEYALQGSNFVTDLVNGEGQQAWGNLAGMFTNGSYWRDMSIGMIAAVGAGLPSRIGVAANVNSGSIVSNVIPDAVVDSTAIRARVLSNITDSQAARSSSNFGQFSQAEGQLQESLGIWPPNGGAYAPIYDTTLGVGVQLDRYGYPGGTYLSPLGDSFEGRALPSSYQATKPYYQYEVIKPIPGVTQSNALPWFGQPGKGVQFQTPNSVQWYIDNGYLRVIQQ